MNQDVLIAKLASTATPTSWSQAYSTLNFYVALSVQQTEDSNTSIAIEGKELLEKLQREFFAIDDKNLTSIKAAVENTVSETPSSLLFSIVLATIKNDVLYIVTASDASVLLKRGESFGIVAKGTDGEIHGFSGDLRPSDIIILQTKAFSEKVPISRISYYLYSHNPTEIAENIAPLVHETPQGTEAAIILNYKPHVAPEQLDNAEEEQFSESEEPTPKTQESSQPSSSKLKLPPIPTFSLSRLPSPQRILKDKKALGLVILALLLVLAVSIYSEGKRREQRKRQEELTAILTPAQKGIEEANTLMSLDKTLALEELVETEQLLSEKKDYFKEGSNEDGEIEKLLEQVQSMKQSIEKGDQIQNQKEIANLKSIKLPSIDFLSFSGGDLVVASSEEDKAVTISSTGTLKDEYEYESGTALSLTSDSQFMYILSDTSVVRIDKGNSKAQEIVKDSPTNANDIEAFGSNIYILSFSPGTITRHAAPTYSGRSYFTTTPTFSSSLSSFAIDGRIWVLLEDGTIKRFNRGTEDPIEIKGLVTPIGKGASLYTTDELSKLYVLDPERSRLLILEKTGSLSTQLEWSEFKKATSFAIDEEAGTGYITTGSALYSFSLSN